MFRFIDNPNNWADAHDNPEPIGLGLRDYCL